MTGIGKDDLHFRHLVLASLEILSLVPYTLVDFNKLMTTNEVEALVRQFHNFYFSI